MGVGRVVRVDWDWEYTPLCEDEGWGFIHHRLERKRA
jgi:hypothetical protein